MQRLLLLSFFIALPLAAQNFSPSASGIGLQGTNIQGVTSPASAAQREGTPQATISPATSTTTISPATSSINNFISPNSTLTNPGNPTAGSTSLDQIPLPLGSGPQILDQTNTAPTPIPEDTSLIITPAEESIRQAQESQIETGPIRNDTETLPGNITGGAIDGGTGGIINGTNGGSGINETGPINNIP